MPPGLSAVSSSYAVAHGALMFVAFGVFLPFGVRNFAADPAISVISALALLLPPRMGCHAAALLILLLSLAGVVGSGAGALIASNVA